MNMKMNINSSNIPKEYIIDKDVLELGAGLGLVSIVAYHLGARRVMMTDADTITLEKMRYNVTQNCSGSTTITTSGAGSDDHYLEESNNETPTMTSSIDCRQLIWNEQLENFHTTHGNFETIVGADVIYTKESLEPLFDTAAFFLIQLQNSNLNDRNDCSNRNKPASASAFASASASAEGQQQQGRFILSRYTKWGDITDATVLDVAKRKS